MKHRDVCRIHGVSLHCHSELVSESQIEHTGLCHPEQQEQSAKRSGVTFYATA